VCGSTNLELARSLGADTVIDYTGEHDPGGGKLYNLALDAVGKRKTSRLKMACAKALAPGGKYISVDDGAARLSASDLTLLTELVEAGKIKPVIDRRYPLQQIANAHRYVEQEHKRGNVIVTVTCEGEYLLAAMASQIGALFSVTSGDFGPVPVDRSRQTHFLRCPQ